MESDFQLKVRHLHWAIFIDRKKVFSMNELRDMMLMVDTYPTPAYLVNHTKKVCEAISSMTKNELTVVPITDKKEIKFIRIVVGEVPRFVFNTINHELFHRHLDSVEFVGGVKEVTMTRELCMLLSGTGPAINCTDVQLRNFRYQWLPTLKRAYEKRDLMISISDVGKKHKSVTDFTFEVLDCA